jgi:hypothetical protein
MTTVSSKQPVNLNIHVLLSLLLVCYGVSKVHCSTVHGSSTDPLSLIEFKNDITNDPHGALSNWNTSTHFCRWSGVNCSSTRPYRVRELILAGQNLGWRNTPISWKPDILIYIDLSSNSFNGPIPLLNRLQNLKYLYLHSNLLQGAIPDALANCSNLV